MGPKMSLCSLSPFRTALAWPGLSRATNHHPLCHSISSRQHHCLTLPLASVCGPRETAAVLLLLAQNRCVWVCVCVSACVGVRVRVRECLRVNGCISLDLRCTEKKTKVAVERCEPREKEPFSGTHTLHFI